MGRRLTMLLLLFALCATAVPAHAETTRTRFQGGFAIAVWSDAQTGTFAVVEYFEDVDYLILILETEIRDADGNVTGLSQIVADANLSPYGTFTIDEKRLTSAALAVSDVPASACEIPESGEPTCTEATMDANVTWTGDGPIVQSMFRFTEKRPGFLSKATSKGTDREAVATGAINETALPADDLERGSIAFSKGGQLTVCTGC